MLNIAPECPRCKEDEVYYKPRHRVAGNVIIYERICKQCKLIYYTAEKIECFHCNMVDSYVKRSYNMDGFTLRYRYCRMCKEVFKTRENVIGYIDYNPVTMHAVLKANDSEIEKLIVNLFGY
jgi:transcriptional regulator NrdR family protein